MLRLLENGDSTANAPDYAEIISKLAEVFDVPQACLEVLGTEPNKSKGDAYTDLFESLKSLIHCSINLQGKNNNE